MSKYFFQLGTFRKLSELELQLVSSQKIKIINSTDYAEIDYENDLQAQTIFESLGGCVRLTKFIKKIQNQDLLQDEIVNILAQYNKSIQFSISIINIPQVQIKYSTLKKQLKKTGQRVRYIKSSGDGLSASVLLNQDVIELIILKSNNNIYISQTISVQNIDQWTNRDRQKPYFDDRKGMLPPKLARMLVNYGLSLSNNQISNIYDPFCGSGTVLMEAAMLGVKKIIGSDLDYDAVQGTQKNLQWLQKQYSLDIKSHVFQHDLTQKITNNIGKIDLVVTEPFLGKPNPTKKELANIFKGLERLYLGSLKKLSIVLNNNAILVIIFPLVESKNKTYNMSNLIDKLGKKGYTLLAKPVVYHRPNATVKRQIHFFKYNKE